MLEKINKDEKQKKTTKIDAVMHKQVIPFREKEKAHHRRKTEKKQKDGQKSSIFISF